MAETHPYVLYYRPSCPFCHKVLDYANEHTIELSLKDIGANDAWREELIELGGKKQVPCLVVDGEALYESDAIIDRLKRSH